MTGKADMGMPRHPGTDYTAPRYAWAPDAMMLCWIIGILVVIAQGINAIHAVSLAHESSEGCYTGSSERTEGVNTDQYSGSDFSFIPPGLSCHYGGERFGTEVTTVDLTPWSPWIFWGGTAVLVACMVCRFQLSSLHRLSNGS